jgi:hypothetical protein
MIHLFQNFSGSLNIGHGDIWRVRQFDDMDVKPIFSSS